MNNSGFSWVHTHEYIVNFLRDKQNKQSELIDLLASVDIGPLNDKEEPGDKFIPLTEIDPFTFFCYIYKYGFVKRLDKLQQIAEKLGAPIPLGTDGVPSAQPQLVWLFRYKYERNRNDIERLWSFFYKALNDTITDADFEDILTIKSVGKTKLTEALFNILPDKYFPINGPAKPYLEEVLNIDTSFSTYSEYVSILNSIREKTSTPFYELSHSAWEWTSNKGNCNYWIFQGNPKRFNIIQALQKNALATWSVTSHKDKIKVGDKVILWVGGKDPGCYALAEVTSAVYEGKDDVSQKHYYTELSKDDLSQRVRIRITHNLSNNPISLELIKKHPHLSKLKIGLQGTNFTATAEEYKTLLEISKHLGPKYWLYAPAENASLWEECFRLGIMSLGWDDLGNLIQYPDKTSIVKELQRIYSTNSSKKNDATANHEFRNVISIGDVIIVKKGRSELLGYGIVASDYYYDESRTNHKSCRKVDWKLKGVWQTDHSLALKTLTDITKYSTEHPDYETYYERLLGIMNKGYNPHIEENNKSSFSAYPLNTIFYGPPGTGKTYHSIKRAAEIIESRVIDNYNYALKIFSANLHDQIEFITFHQNYSYEDFVQGLRPDIENDSQLTFNRKDGVFKQISQRALDNLRDADSLEIQKLSFEDAFKQLVIPLIEEQVEIEIQMRKVSYYITDIVNNSIQFRKASGGTAHTLSISTLKRMYEVESVLTIQGLSIYYEAILNRLLTIGKKRITESERVQKKNYVLIIDEINRANISRVFGELITLIEPDKRSQGSIPISAKLPSGDPFLVPSNLYIIGTMNTADKSIALIDIALRRRFEFEPMYPMYEVNGIAIRDNDILKKLNKVISEKKGYDFQIGHSFFMDDSFNLVNTMNRKIVPLLLEYFMNDEKEVKEILQLAGLKIEQDSWPIRIAGRND